jgi:hypothetical protein
MTQALTAELLAFTVEPFDPNHHTDLIAGAGVGSDDANDDGDGAGGQG